jgi:rubrerythrin
MVKVDRKENPTFTKYDDRAVKNSLKIDFNKKCYLCEEVTRHFEVEHFYPQKYYLHLIDKYENLFYICQKCNKIKPKIANTNSENEILNCCDIDIEKYIKLKLNSKECIVEISKITTATNLDKQIEYTIKVLDRIYNGVNSKSDSCEDLRDEIKDTIISFRKKLDKYSMTKLKRAIIEEIKEELNTASSYSTFKRWIIRDNQTLTKEFQKYIDEVG